MTDFPAMDRNEKEKEILMKFWREMERSADARALFFADGVILVEGETEIGTFPVWQDGENELREPRDKIGDVAYYAVGGKYFKTMVHLLNEFNIPWVFICDGDALAEPNSIFAQLGEEGSDDFTEAKEKAKTLGVFTLSKSFEETFEDLQVIQDKKKEALQEVGKSKVRQGRYIAENTSCPPEVNELLTNAMNGLLAKKNSQ